MSEKLKLFYLLVERLIQTVINYYKLQLEQSLNRFFTSLEMRRFYDFLKLSHTCLEACSIASIIFE
jgi:hypothetical protein